ncbi:hypothetical protein [Leclercia sp.]|uniref:hypothetical protein n=1 Tax=Leclercia sp. TaxID=1898428 RepID=UPI0028AB70BD|nr:hypothetical protein [Leclercia sp.]
MATRYNFTNNGALQLPVNQQDVTYTTANMGADSDKVDVYIEFYDAAGNQVTPTGGQVYVYGLPMAKSWLPAVGSPINATQFTAPYASYTPPMMDGLCTQARVRFVGITGAVSALALAYKR